MSEERRTLRCLACNTVRWDNGGPVPERCPACGAAWREPGVAIVERDPGPFRIPDGASISRSE